MQLLGVNNSNEVVVVAVIVTEVAAIPAFTVPGLLLTQWRCSRPHSPDSRIQGVSNPTSIQQGQRDASRQYPAMVAPFQRRTLLGHLLHCWWGVPSGKTSREEATRPMIFSLGCTYPSAQNPHDYPTDTLSHMFGVWVRKRTAALVKMARDSERAKQLNKL